MALQTPPGGTTVAERALIAGAIQSALFDQPFGVPQLNSEGGLPVQSSRTRTGNAAAVAALTLALGEQAYITDQRRMVIGDGATLGGIAFGVGESPGSIHVHAFGTPAENAEAVADAVDRANAGAGEAEGPYTNDILCHPGLYNFTGMDTVALTVSDVNLISVIPGAALFLDIEDFESFDPIISVGSCTCRVQGIRFVSLTRPGIHLVPSNLRRSLSDMIFDSAISAGITVEAGEYDQLRVHRVRGGASGYPNICGGVDGAIAASTVRFTDCESGTGAAYFGGATAAGAGTMSGTILRCDSLATTTNIKLAGTMHACRWKSPITRLVAGAKLWDNLFSTTSAALGNNSDSVAIYADGNRCRGALLGTSVTNSVTSANNRESIGVALW